MRRLLAVLAVIVTVSAACATASAAPYTPPSGRLFAGVTGGTSPAEYERALHSHAPVFQFFTSWNMPFDGMFAAAERARARLMLHLSTLTMGREVITPLGIAGGRGDAYLLRLNAQWRRTLRRCTYG